MRSITLVGLPWARDLVTRIDALDDFVEFPGHPALPERTCDASARDAFLAECAHGRSTSRWRCTAAAPSPTASGGVERIVGEARYAGADDARGRECAVVVDERWRRAGVATRLLRHLVAQAQRSRFERLQGDIAEDNDKVLAWARRSGWAVQPDPEDVRLFRAAVSLSAMPFASTCGRIMNRNT
jgi:GNAT superfamily N-acetyltransferase